jgi:saccharopine dehydrogenase-like NADP-dependent oxidoreductase
VRVALLGCGMMGAAAARFLAESGVAADLVVADRDPASAQTLAADVGCEGLALDVADASATSAVLSRVDGVALALPWPATRRVVEAARKRQVVIGAIARPPDTDLPWLRALQGISLLAPIGLEPGLTEILARRCAQRVGAVRELQVRCGGVPVEPRPPLGYEVLFGGRHLPIGLRQAYAIEDGRLIRVARFTGVEHVDIDAVGVLEAYHDGMVPWLVEDRVVGSARDVSQKTLRWPGFADTVGVLGRLGLLDEEPVEVDGVNVVPRHLVEAVLVPRLRGSGPPRDVTVLKVTAVGAQYAAETSLVERHRGDLTAMARVTGAALAAGLHGLLADRVVGEGWLRPNEVYAGAAGGALIAQLAQFGVHVREYPARAHDERHAPPTGRPGPPARVASDQGWT